jgi:hypothetical protein
MRCIAFLSLAFPVLAGVLGCGSGVEKPEYNVHPVTGVVKVNGKPEALVSVSFIPVDGAKADQTTATGTTNESGEFTLSIPGGKEGAPAGQYRVIFTKLLKRDGTPLGPDEMAADAGAENVLPAIYADPAQTPQGAEVPEGGKKFEFEIKGS